MSAYIIGNCLYWYSLGSDDLNITDVLSSMELHTLTFFNPDLLIICFILFLNTLSLGLDDDTNRYTVFLHTCIF